MKKKITELLKKRRVAAGLTAIVLAVAVGSVSVVQQKSQIPELPVYTDPEMETNIEEEETPLADKPVVKTTTSKKTTTKKVKMKKARKNIHKRASCHINYFQKNSSDFQCFSCNQDNSCKKD